MDSFNVHNICRVCLQENSYLIPIYEQFNNYYISDVLIELCGLTITKDDNLPPNICNNCATKVIDGYEIRRLSINSDQYIRHQLSLYRVSTHEDYNKESKIIDDQSIGWENNSSSNIQEKETVDQFNYLTDSNLIKSDKDEWVEKEVLFIEKNTDSIKESIPKKGKTAKKGPTPKKLMKRKKVCSEIVEDSSDDFVLKGSDEDGEEQQDLIESDKEMKDIYCNLCEKTFPTRNSFRRHQNYHKIEKTKCPLCPKEFAHKSNLKRHLLVHKDKKPFTCDKCGKAFQQSFHLYEHIKIHRNLRTDKDDYVMKCEMCGEETSSYALFTIHMRDQHNVNKIKPFKCEVCGMLFASKQGMYRHIDNIHENNRRNLRNRDKNFLCNTCGKSFYTNFHLDVHIRSHTGERPYKCKDCNKSFSQTSGLRMHMYIHTGERPFKCKKCDKTFNQYGHVREHMLTHTDLRPHVCNICNHGFRVKGNLTAHMLIHTGKKPFVCGVCNKRFIQKTKLDQHIKRVHGGDGKDVELDLIEKSAE